MARGIETHEHGKEVLARYQQVQHNGAANQNEHISWFQQEMETLIKTAERGFLTKTVHSDHVVEWAKLMARKREAEGTLLEHWFVNRAEVLRREADRSGRIPVEILRRDVIVLAEEYNSFISAFMRKAPISRQPTNAKTEIQSASGKAAVQPSLSDSAEEETRWTASDDEQAARMLSEASQKDRELQEALR